MDTALLWATTNGVADQNTTAYESHAATIAFSDASLATTSYKASGNFVEENVAVLPFVFCKSQGTSGNMTNISNVSFEQIHYGIPQGKIQLSSWTGRTNDADKPVYLLQRTKDSGTRRTHTGCSYYGFNDFVHVYIYDKVGDFWFDTETNNPSGVQTSANPGASPNNVVNAGILSENLNWGPGYVGGGDIRTALGYAQSKNDSIGFISFADAKSVGGGNWTNVISFNGMWPTAAGAALRGVSVTNDFSPITSGYYPLWSDLVMIHPIDMDLTPSPKISTDALGDSFTPGTFLGVFNAQSGNNGGVVLPGSIENEIIASKVSTSPFYPNTAIPLSEMHVQRQSVGADITPF